MNSIGEDVILPLDFCKRCGEMVGAFAGTIVGVESTDDRSYVVRADREAFASPCRCQWPDLVWSQHEIEALLWVL